MKTNRNNVLFLLGFMLMVVAIFTSCEREEKRGTPSIDYIRITNPEKADSALSAAFMGQLIAIIGENLGGTVAVMFNDREATLNPTYVTEKSVLVSVPSHTPDEINDKMILTFNDGTYLEYDFIVEIPAPEIYGIVCEYVPDGGTAVIIGDYFYLPTTVTFEGGLEGEVTGLFTDRIEVTVPEGASTGKITVATNFGQATSPFIFRDNRNTIVDFDDKPHENWTAAVIPTDTSIYDGISGNYGMIASGAARAWNWENNLALFCWGEGARDTEEPLATGFIPDLDFRFELKIDNPWTDVRMEIYFSPYGYEHGRDAVNPAFYYFTPWVEGPVTTNGWVTISIPLSEFNQGSSMPQINFEDWTYTTGEKYTNLNMMVFGPQDADASNTYPVELFVDNIRIVPREVD